MQKRKYFHWLYLESSFVVSSVPLMHTRILGCFLLYWIVSHSVKFLPNDLGNNQILQQ